MKWELKLENGKRVLWSGETGEDAARRYVDCVLDAVAVVATRPAYRHGLFVLGDPRQIIG